MIHEFKKFALKGNIVDLAVGVIIGGAFGKIVASLVNDIIMPALGFFTGKIDLSAQKFVITEGNDKVAELSIKYGQFIQTMIDFFLIAFSIFIVIKVLTSFRKKEEKVVEDKPSKEELLLTEIRDLLKEKNK